MNVKKVDEIKAPFFHRISSNKNAFAMPTRFVIRACGCFRATKRGRKPDINKRQQDREKCCCQGEIKDQNGQERETLISTKAEQKQAKKVLTRNVVRTSKLTFCFHTRKIVFFWSSRNLNENKILCLIQPVFHLRYFLNLAA